jgi:predicted peptidase
MCQYADVLIEKIGNLKMNLNNTYMSRILLMAFVLFVSLFSHAQNELYEKKQFVKGSDTLRYRILYPENYSASKKYPVVLFLHGAGERGNDNEAQLKYVSTLFAVQESRKKYPAIVIMPQCPKIDFWARILPNTSSGPQDSLGRFMFVSEQPVGKALGLVEQLMDSIAAGRDVDTRKIYIGGLSMGGMGTFEMLWRKPGFFAAAFPICGGGDPSKVSLYAKGFPVWIFHGDADRTVPVSHSRRMVNALRSAGAKVKYTEYPGVGHNSWDSAFAEPDLLKWLFDQKK